MRRTAVALLAAAALAAPAAAFDRVLLKDGRTIEGTLVAGSDDSVVRLQVKGLEIPIPAADVEKTFVENLDTYKPKTPEEADFLKKGWVLFEGHWLSKTARDDILGKRAAADKAAVEDTKKRQNWKSAVTKESTHFTMKSNAEPALVNDYMDRLEEFYKYFCDEWGMKISSAAKNGKLAAELHRSWGDTFTISSAGGAISASLNGFDGDINLVYDPDDPDSSLRDLYEAACYQLVFFISPGFMYPNWMRDGLARYYATATHGADGKLAFGAPQYVYVQELEKDRKDNKLPPIMEVLDSQNTKWTPAHSAEMWSFVRFLMDSPKYGKGFRAFVGNLPNNKDVGIHHEVDGNRKGATIELVDHKLCVAAMEKRLGVALPKLEAEWKASLEESVPMTPEAYYLAGRSSLEMATEGGEKDKPPPEDVAQRYVQTAFEQFAAADAAGSKSAVFYRHYAELLRDGGIDDPDNKIVPRSPDGAAALKMIQKAIALAPVDAENYIEAANDLLVDGPSQDLDRASTYADVAKIVAGPRNYWIKSQADDVYAKVEPARERRRKVVADASESAKTDTRHWHVAFFFVKPAPQPENLKDLSTIQLRDLIRTGKVGPEDSLYQSTRPADPKTGELLPGTEAWEKGWVKVKDCPLFVDDLAAAPKPGAPAAPAPTGGTTAPPAGGAGTAGAGGG